MSQLRPDQVRSLAAAAIAAEVTDLKEMRTPYFLARKASAQHKTFAVGLGRSIEVKDSRRQRPSEGTFCETTIRVLIAYQLEHMQQLESEALMGELRQQVIAAMVARWSVDVATLWSEDIEATADTTNVRIETTFLCYHTRPLE